MKRLFLSSVMFAALIGFSHAAPLSVSYSGLPSNGKYFAPNAFTFTAPYEENVTGSTSSRTSPFFDNSTAYDAVEAGGSADFGFPLTIDRVSARASASIFGVGNNSFTFVWGTPDTYNLLSFFENGSFLGSVTGSGAPTGGNGTGSYLATVTGMGAYNSVRFETGNINAFEFAGVSAVPLPASAPMFGAALLALVGFSYGMNRWVAPKGKKTAAAA